jgi:hypothetical protein
MCLVLALAGGLLAPAAARAGSYQVAVCHDPSTGAPAPLDGMTFPFDGFDAFTGVYLESEGECSAGGYVYATLDGARTHGPSDLGEWQYSPPPGLAIDAVQIYRSFYAGPGAVGQSPTDSIQAVAPGGAAAVLGGCSQAVGCTSVGSDAATEFGSSNLVAAGPFSAGTVIQGTAACGGGQTCTLAGPAICPEIGADACTAANHLDALLVTLEDNAPPVPGQVSGTLVSPGVLAGSAGVTVHATDAGSGLLRAALGIDGKWFADASFGSNGGRCVAVGGGSGAPLRFDWNEPCPLSGSATIAFDTSTVPDGSHAALLTVTDAAGNSATAWSGTVQIDNAPQGGIPQIYGDAQVSQTLVADAGSWSPAATAFSYQWLRCNASGGGCMTIPGATSSSYAVAPADTGHELVVVVTASDADGSTSARSAPTGAVLASAGTRAGAGAGGAGPGAGRTPNGVHACERATLRATVAGAPSVTVPLGRTVTVRGSLRCGHTPIARANVAVAITGQDAFTASRRARIRTRRDGSFAYVLPRGPSRRIALSYRAFSNDATPSATASATVLVMPSISLSITPTSTSNGHTITFTGNVSGGHEPPGGLTLEIEYREGTNWMIYDTTRTRRGDGRYLWQYTFRRTTQPITYWFRVAIPSSGVAGYPYVPVASAARGVHVVP